MKQKKNNDNAKILIVAGLLVVVLAATMILINILERIPEIDPGTVGNTGGNINNTGLFCEADGKVYFANAYDSGSLYSMNPDQSDVKKLYDGNCRYINSGGDYIYFSMSSTEGGTGLGYVLKNFGIYRAKKSGHKITALTDEPSSILVLVGNELFFQGNTGSGIGLKKLSITKSDAKSEILENEYVLNPACVVNRNIYYGGTKNDHYLYCYNIDSNTASAIWEGNVWNPIYDGNYYYYMDISNNYSICRYSPSTQSVDILTHDRADTFNVGNGYIYYSTSVSDTPGIYRMATDGSNPEKIMDGIFTDINITSTYTYFHAYDSAVPMYCTPNFTGAQAQVFSAAKDAIN